MKEFVVTLGLSPSIRHTRTFPGWALAAVGILGSDTTCLPVTSVHACITDAFLVVTGHGEQGQSYACSRLGHHCTTESHRPAQGR